MPDFNDKKWIWVGRLVSAGTGLFMLSDAVVHLTQSPIVIQIFQGYPPGIIVPLAIVELVCVALYLIPRTAVLGAIFLTGYLGGAVDYNVRAGSPFLTVTMLPVYVAFVLWIGLYLRSKKLRRVVPVDN